MSSSDSRRQRHNAAKQAPAGAVETVTMTAAPAPDAPAPSLPVAQPFVTPKKCVLAHDIVSHTLRGGINYLYLGRFDANPMGGVALNMKIVLQVAMPLDGFLNSFFMLEATIRKMQMEGVVTKEMVKAGRARYAPESESGI